MEPEVCFHAQHTAVERRQQAMNKRQQRRRIRDSKSNDEGSLRTRRRSNESVTNQVAEPIPVEVTAEAQMWDLQMQNAFLRHQLVLAEQKKDWLAQQLQESQARLASLMECGSSGRHSLGAPQESSSRLSSSSSASDSDAVPWNPSPSQQQQPELPAAATTPAGDLPEDTFDLFQLDELEGLLPDVPEGLESVDSLTAHLPMGI
ncbi:hypothetical protein WJX74_001267 [Apatococcus lobatus]|uniref:Uncharacterized protein n=1 Tax=Apatococcus lobatus TaxID=904363 RepID=A0AAW1QGW5_9CHLO